MHERDFQKEKRKNHREEKMSEDVSCSQFSPSRKHSESPYKIFVIALHDIIGLQNFSYSFYQSYPGLRCVICTGVTLFAPCNLHWYYIWTALRSASQKRFFFSCVLLMKVYHLARTLHCLNKYFKHLVGVYAQSWYPIK